MSLGDKYTAEQPHAQSPEKSAAPPRSPTKGTRNLSRQPSLQKLSPQQSVQQQPEQEVASFRRGNEAGAAVMEPSGGYDQSYGANETAPMDASVYGAGAEDGYQYDANSSFANYDPTQTYVTDYGDQQQYEAQYTGGATEDYYQQPQGQSAGAYLDNDGKQQYQYEAQGDYKYQPEPEYEYKPYQAGGGQQRQAAPVPVAAQQSKPSYSEPPAPQPATVPAPTAPRSTTGSTRPTAGGATKPNARSVPQSRAPASSGAASSSERK